MLDLSLNKLHHTIPPSFGNLTQLRELYLSNNLLSGPITDSLCLLTQLVALDLGYNKLAGQIPTRIGDLTGLKVLMVQINQLSGNLPTSIGRLAHLTHLSVYTNALEGTIPAFLSNLTQLKELYMFNNRFTGTIPSFLGSLTDLTDLFLNDNNLHGPIPPSVGQLIQLVNLGLNFNSLTGSIPMSFCALSKLEELALHVNFLTSTLPACLGNLPTLLYISLEANRFDGSVPESFGNLTGLTSLLLSNNQLTGTLPVSLGELPDLYLIYAFSNHFTGPIPSGFWNIFFLEFLYLNNNHFEGSLPDFTITAPAFLLHLNLSSNHLTGSIPESIGIMSDLVVLSVADNLISGTIPEVIGLMDLGSVQLNKNRLLGTIPSTFTLMQSLVVLTLQDNGLTGTLDQAFSNAQTKLITVQLDNNEFTGTLPAVLFQLPALVSLSIVGTCLHGTLPDTLCSATSLEALVLYGLTTGSSCRTTGIQALSTQRRAFKGHFPACVLSLPMLRTLLLASNALTGRLDDVTSISPTLLQLDLSHNQLSGPIANNIQNHSWLLLDLSHNKLNGVLNKDFYHTPNLSVHAQLPSVLLYHTNYTYPTQHSVVSLDTNRLSGVLPKSIHSLQDVTVLAGNLFQCKYDHSDLPSQDSAVDTYQCASNLFDLSVYVWLGLFSVAAVVVLAVMWLRAKEAALVRALYQRCAVLSLPHDVKPQLMDALETFAAFDVVVKTAGYCAAFCVVVLMPYYAIISQYKGTHTNQYAYVLSAIYTSGIAAFVVDAVLLGIVLVLMYVVYSVATSKTKHAYVDAIAHTSSDLSARAYVWVLFILTNVTVVLGVNVAFVYTVLYQNTDVQTLAQVLLSLFKLGWSTAASPMMVRKLSCHFLPDSDDVMTDSFFALQLLVSLFNNIAIPCMVVMAIDPNCFSEILVPPSSTKVDYLLPVCVEDLQADEVCTALFFEQSSLRFSPPYTYSYQCSASFITSYAPAFIYMSISIVFLTPLMHYVMLQVHARLPVDSPVRAVLSEVIPRILQPPPADSDAPRDKRKRPLFRSVGTLVTLLMQLGVLLTFGAIFPPIALAMAVSMVAAVCTARVELQRFVHIAVATERLQCLSIVNAECLGVGTLDQLQLAVKIIVCYCCAFYTLFLFDTLGDAVGFAAAGWVLAVFPFTPISVLLGQNVWTQRTSQASEISMGVEMKGVQDNNSSECKSTVNALHNTVV